MEKDPVLQQGLPQLLQSLDIVVKEIFGEAVVVVVVAHNDGISLMYEQGTNVRKLLADAAEEAEGEPDTRTPVGKLGMQ